MWFYYVIAVVIQLDIIFYISEILVLDFVNISVE